MAALVELDRDIDAYEAPCVYRQGRSLFLTHLLAPMPGPSPICVEWTPNPLRVASAPRASSVAPMLIIMNS